MAFYTQQQKDEIINYIDNAFKYVNVHIRSNIKDIALKAMSKTDNEFVDVSNAVTNYINENYSCYNNPIIAESLQIIPKSKMLISRNEILKVLEEYGYELSSPLMMFASSSVKINFTTPEKQLDRILFGSVKNIYSNEIVKCNLSMYCNTLKDLTFEQYTSDKNIAVQYTAYCNKTGLHVVYGIATDSNGIKLMTARVFRCYSDDYSFDSSLGQFTKTKFDSGWTDLVEGFYLSDIHEFSFSVRSTYESSNDYLVILGKKTDGSVIILHDFLNESNNGKTVMPDAIINNSIYGKGNLSKKNFSTKYIKNNKFTLNDDIRQIKIISETPNWEDSLQPENIFYYLYYKHNESLL